MEQQVDILLQTRFAQGNEPRCCNEHFARWEAQRDILLELQEDAHA